MLRANPPSKLALRGVNSVSSNSPFASLEISARVNEATSAPDGFLVCAVAMNEPAVEFGPCAHVSRLARSSLRHRMLKDLATKPRYGLTLGMGDILRSRKILLIVSGQAKQSAMKRLLQPWVSPRFPASFLWLHSDVTILCDRDAVAKSRRFI